MKEFMISERYRLEIHWSKINYGREGLANISGCYLSGPVLKEIEQLNDEDFIKLDFANQYIIFVKNYYIMKFFWEGVKHTPEKIFLYNVKAENMNLNTVPKFQDNDYIVINTKDHEDEKHQHHMTYPAYLLKADGSLYDFGSK